MKRERQPKCIITGGPADWHHVLSRKAYPELKDEKWNLCPLSREMHTLWHMKGMTYMADTYFQVKVWLKNQNWRVCEVKGKWVPQTYVKETKEEKV